MNPEERTGFLITAIALLTIPFFFITAVLGSYREVQPEFLQEIPILDFLISTFPWDAVVLFFTSILVYGGLIYFGWIGYRLYKGKFPELKLQKRFIDIIYNRTKRTENRETEPEEEEPDFIAENENENLEEKQASMDEKEGNNAEKEDTKPDKGESKYLKEFI